MAALPPSRHARRARAAARSPVPSMPDVPRHLAPGRDPAPGRGVYVSLAPTCCTAPSLPPDFDGATALLTATEFAKNFPDRVPGSRGSARRGRLGRATALASTAFGVCGQRFHAKIPGRGSVAARERDRMRQGRSTRAIVVIAHRDNPPTSAGANDNGSGTAALIELARSFATPQAPPQPPAPTTRDRLPLHRRRRFRRARRGAISPTSTRFASASSPSSTSTRSRGRARRSSCSRATRPRFPSATLVRTAAARIVERDRSASRGEPAAHRPAARPRLPVQPATSRHRSSTAGSPRSP